MPLVAIDWLANLGDLKSMAEGGNTLQVSNQVICLNLKGRVIAPLIRITNLGDEFGKLFKGFSFSGIAHPGQGFDTLAIGDFQVVYELEHLALGLGREVKIDIDLADGLAQRTLNE